MSLRPLPFREVKRKLEAAGFFEASRRGSHIKFIKVTDNGTWVTIVPFYREVAVGTLRSILRQAGISVEDFDRL